MNRGVQLTTAAVMLIAALSSPLAASATSTSSPSPTPLVGTHWVLTGPGAVGAASASVSITALFDGKTVSGESGCNAYHAPYQARGRRMTIGKSVATTLRACPPGPTAVERTYLQRLRRVTAFRISGKTLSLSSRTNQVLLTYRASVGAEEIVGRWEVTGYYTGTAISSVIANSSITAEFSATDVSGDGGCNLYSGPYQVTGSTISIGPLNSTQRACADIAVDTQERQYLTALELAASFSVTGSRLDLLRDDGGIAVTFVAATT